MPQNIWTAGRKKERNAGGLEGLRIISRRAGSYCPYLLWTHSLGNGRTVPL